MIVTISGALLQFIGALLERSSAVQQHMVQSNGFMVLSYMLTKVRTIPYRFVICIFCFLF